MPPPLVIGLIATREKQVHLGTEPTLRLLLRRVTGAAVVTARATMAGAAVAVRAAGAAVSV